MSSSPSGRNGACDVERSGVGQRTNNLVRVELPKLAAAHGLSIRAVARALHVNSSHLSRVTSGELPASGSLAGRIAEVFELPVDYFPEYRLWRLHEAIDADPAFRDRLYDDLPAS